MLLLAVVNSVDMALEEEVVNSVDMMVVLVKTEVDCEGGRWRQLRV